MPHYDDSARLRDEADRERFAIRKLEEQMAAEVRELARAGEAFEHDKDRAKASIAAERRREHWGHDPEGPASR
jgi:hypothetical protein